MATLAGLSVATGIMDVLVPVLRGEEPFTPLMRLVDHYGPGYLFIHILVHNLGLACLVPGVGLVAATFEKDKGKRVLAARILFVTVILSLFVAFQYLLQARERFDLTLVIPLLAVEAFAVSLLAWRGFLVVRAFVPTPRAGWSFVHPARELAPWFVASNIALAVAALVEVGFVTGAFA